MPDPVAPIALAFERGDVQEVRRAAQALLSSGASDATKARARELLARTGLDPQVLAVLVGMALTVTAIVATLALL